MPVVTSCYGFGYVELPPENPWSPPIFRLTELTFSGVVSYSAQAQSVQSRSRQQLHILSFWETAGLHKAHPRAVGSGL